MLPDVLAPDLKIVFCGTAAGDRSARLQMYYAGHGNKFWRVLCQAGLTPRVLSPADFRELPVYGLGLTDLAKGVSGMDSNIRFDPNGSDVLRKKIEQFRPKILCFNGKKAGQLLIGRRVGFGLLRETVGDTMLFVAPSTSGAANGYWDVTWWCELADLARSKS